MGKDHLTKKDMKVDELEHALLGAKDYATSHVDQLKKWAPAGVAVLALVAVGWGFLAYRAGSGDKRLAAALAILDTPLASDAAAAASGQKTFATPAERLAAARKELDALAKASPSSKAGRAAATALLGIDGATGLSGARLDAVAAFATSEAGTLAGGIAASSYIDAKAASGQPKEAIEAAKRYLDARNPPLPKDVLIYKLAGLYEKGGQPAEAKSFYQRLVSEFPDSAMRAEAQQKLAAM